MAILFKTDWAKYPRAIIHTNTKNKSFVRTAGLYKKMKIKNHSFILALHNPLLEFVDPHDPDITEEQLVMVIEECKENFWYYIREVARLPASSGDEADIFLANRANIGLFWLFWNHIMLMLIQPRQTGKSVSTDTLMRYLINISLYNSKVSLLTKDDKLRVENVLRLKEIEKILPPYLKMTTRKDTNNTETITVNALGNRYLTNVAQASPKAARNINRGQTILVNHIDEFAYIANIEHTLGAMLAAGGAAMDAAKEKGEPYGTIFTTTAGKPDTADGKFAYNIYKNGMPFTEKLYDAESEEELVTIIKKNSKDGLPICILDFNHRQLGKSDQWLKDRIAAALSKGGDAERDFLNRWTSGTDSSPIPKDLLNVLLNSKTSDHYAELSEYGYVTRWYVTEEQLATMSETEMVMGLDTSDAIGNDDIALVVRSNKTGAVLAVGEYNETNLLAFGEWLLDWLIRFKKLTIIIERKSSGMTIVDIIARLGAAKGIDVFRRIFNWIVDDALIRMKTIKEVFGQKAEHREPGIYDRLKRDFGYATAGAGRASREALYGKALIGALKYTGDKTHDPILISQISSLALKNNRLDHTSGGKDDIVIAYLLSYWFLKEARNKELYGIDPKNVLSGVMDALLLQDGNAEKIMEIKKQQRLKHTIEGMFKVLRAESNPFKADMLRTKIKYLSKSISSVMGQTLNIENMLEKIDIEKKKNRRYP